MVEFDKSHLASDYAMYYNNESAYMKPLKHYHDNSVKANHDHNQYMYNCYCTKIK